MSQTYQGKVDTHNEFIKLYPVREEMGFKTKTALQNHLGVSKQTFRTWELEYLGESEENEEEFDLREYLSTPKNKRLLADMYLVQLRSPRPNSQLVKQMADLIGELSKDKDNSDFSTEEYIRAGRLLKDRLKGEASGGRCPICGFNQGVRAEVCEASEPELEPGGDMETVALPDRPT